MKAIKYNQIRGILLESGIDFLGTDREEIVKFFESYKNNLTEDVGKLIFEVINEIIDGECIVQGPVKSYENCGVIDG